MSDESEMRAYLEREKMAEIIDRAAEVSAINKCNLATIAVMFLEFAPMFGLTIPNYAAVLAMAQQLQAVACGVPPAPTQNTR